MHAHGLGRREQVHGGFIALRIKFFIPSQIHWYSVFRCSSFPCYERHETNNYLSASLQSAIDIVKPGISAFAEPKNSFWGFLEKLESHLLLYQAALLKSLSDGPKNGDLMCKCVQKVWITCCSLESSTIQKWNYFEIHAISLILVLEYGAHSLKIW